MSADNWTICPKCNQKKYNTLTEMKEKLNQSYGKVEAPVYLKMVQDIRDFEQSLNYDADQTDSSYTLREDYEQGIKNEEYYVSYCGHCDRCGFSFEYEHSER